MRYHGGCRSLHRPRVQSTGEHRAVSKGSLTAWDWAQLPGTASCPRLCICTLARRFSAATGAVQQALQGSVWSWWLPLERVQQKLWACLLSASLPASSMLGSGAWLHLPRPPSTGLPSRARARDRSPGEQLRGCLAVG